jgi:ABC-type nitrate/sulfonate/bicarbonate transport system substrate-binding protein
MRAREGVSWQVTRLRLLGALALLLLACQPSGAGQPASTAPPADTPSVAARGAGYRPAPLAPPVKVKMGLVPGVVSNGGLYIAQEKGYFVEEGLDLEVEEFKTGSDMMPLLGTGQLDIAGGSTSSALFNAVGRGVALRIVGDKGHGEPGWEAESLMLRRDLLELGQVNDYADLRGRSIGMNGSGHSLEVMLALALARGGLTLQDVAVQNLAYPEMLPAFANGVLDAALVVEPFLTQLEQRGLARRWKAASEIAPGKEQVAVIMYSEQFAANVEAARRWMVAYVRGLRDYNDAFRERRKGWDEVVAILVKTTTIKDPSLFEVMERTALDPDGRVDLPSLQRALDYFERTGAVRQPPDLTKIVDLTFSDYAAQVLGPYQP